MIKIKKPTTEKRISHLEQQISRIDRWMEEQDKILQTKIV